MSISSTNTLTADVDVDVPKTTFVSHSVRRPEYKEYAFQTERNEVQNLSIKNKVAEFWEVIDTKNYAAPQSTLFKPKFIRECVDGDNDTDADVDDDTSVEGSTSYNEDDKKRISLLNQKWTHTLCLFKKRGLDKLAFAARPKLRNRCEAKFALEYSDEVCDSFVADYGQMDISSDMGSSSY